MTPDSLRIRRPRNATLLLLAILLISQAATFATLNSYGTFVDEVWYFRAAWLIEDWVQRVATGRAPLADPDPAVWEYNFEHPPFAKWVFAASDALLGAGVSQERYGPDYDPRVDKAGSIRPPMRPGPLGPIAGMRAGALVFLLLAQIAAFRLARAEAGDAAGLFAAAAIPAMPHLFGHAHFACLDFPVAALGLVSLDMIVHLARSEHPRLEQLAALGLVFGCGVATKLSTLFLLAAIVPWTVVVARRRSVPILVALALGAPIVLYVSWPYLWADPIGRLRDLAQFHLTHRSFPVYFLGQQYDGYTVPRTYLPVTLVLTTPIPFLVLALAGCRRLLQRRGVVVLLVLSAAATMLPFAVLHAPVYDGVRHFLLTPLLIAVLAGIGVVTVAERAATHIQTWTAQRRRLAHAGAVVAAVAVLGSGVWAVKSVQPYPLAYYNAFVHGPRAGLPPPQGVGLESTCWGAEAVTPAVIDWMNSTLPEGATLDFNAGSYTALREYQRYGMLRKDLRFAEAGEYWVLETNQAYWTAKYFWKLFRTGQAGPFHLVKSFGLDGIDLVRVYQRAAAQ